MTLREYMWAAVDIVIDIAAENGIKYRRGDFYLPEGEEREMSAGENPVRLVGASQGQTGVMVRLWFGHHQIGDVLKNCTKGFSKYSCCAVEHEGFYFYFTFGEIDKILADAESVGSLYRKKPGGARRGGKNGRFKKLWMDSVGEGNRAEEWEVLARLTSAAQRSDVTITYSHKLFFLRLLDYAIKWGRPTEIGLSVDLSVNELSEELDIPFRTVTQSLPRLASCGALVRTPRRGGYPRKPNSTTIAKEFYRKENPGKKGCEKMKQPVGVDVFDNDERIFINKVSEGTAVKDFTRMRLLSVLRFDREISTEPDVLDFLDGLTAKVECMTDGEWDELRRAIPFEVFCDAESNVDEVPEDEEEV